MEKWAYKYSFISGLLFLSSFILKEVVLFSPGALNVFVFVLPFVFMILYVVGLFLGFLKYSILNDNILLKIASILMLISYPLIILAELLERIFLLSSTSNLFASIPKFLLIITLILFGIALYIQKNIYGKFTILQGTCSLILSLSFIIPIFFVLQLPIFLLLFISLTHLVNKREVKKDEINGRLL